MRRAWDKLAAPLRAADALSGAEGGSFVSCERSSECQSRLRSLHLELSDSIRATFFSRRQALICFSRSIATRISEIVCVASFSLLPLILRKDHGGTWPDADITGIGTLSSLPPSKVITS